MACAWLMHLPLLFKTAEKCTEPVFRMADFPGHLINLAVFVAVVRQVVGG